MNRRAYCVLLAASALGSHCVWAEEPAYPSRAVTVVVPFPAGGVADVLPRIVGQRLSDKWGVGVVVENKVGASGNIGMGQVARAAPDGYTLGLAPAGNLTVNPSLFPKLPFNTDKDLVPVALLATSPNVLVVNSMLPIHSVKELVAYAKSHPKTLNFASPGVGSGAHLAGELLNQDAHIDMLHVPFGGMAPAVNALLSGTVNIMFAGVSTILPHVQNGKLRAIAVAGPARLGVLPQVPTVIESGFPGFDVTSWYGLVAPAGIPPAVLQKLTTDIAAVLAQSDVRAKFEALGVEPANMGPKEFGALIREERSKWSAIVAKAGIKPLD